MCHNLYVYLAGFVPRDYLIANEKPRRLFSAVSVLSYIYRDCILYNLGQYWPFLLAGYAYNVGMLMLWLLFSFSRRPVQLLLRFITRIIKRLHLNRDPDKALEGLERTAERFHTSMQHLRAHKGEIARRVRGTGGPF